VSNDPLALIIKVQCKHVLTSEYITHDRNWSKYNITIVFARQVHPRRVLFYEEHRSMHYTTELLDRSTGDLKEVSLGDWITVTELGVRYGVGSKKVRSILHHMGLLQSEGQHGRYRLTPNAVEQGLGKRIEKARNSKWPFDVISPEGQKLIAAVWDETVADLERERLSDPIVQAAETALQAFKSRRASAFETQQEVCWLLMIFTEGLQRKGLRAERS
jgi:ribosomal protein S25